MGEIVSGGYHLKRSARSACIRGLAFVLVLSFIATAGVGSARADDREDCEKTSGEQAVAACTRAIDSKAFRGGELAKLYSMRGSELAADGKYDGAIKDLTTSTDIDPKASTFLELGHAYRRQRNLDR